MNNVSSKLFNRAAFVVWLCHLASIFLLVGDPVPGVNESHYLAKAKHAWDSSFAPGDIFLDSANTHGLFGIFAGSMTQILPLSAAAWIGRLICWSMMAFAWTMFIRSLAIPLVYSSFLLVGWHVAVTWGNWAGEWAIGGFEAKSLAYPIVIAALARSANGYWKSCWILLGFATALHCLAGGWAAISIAIVWVLRSNLRTAGFEQFPAILLGLVIAMVGLLPAAAGLLGPAAHGPAQIHTFNRLAHHLSPQMFTQERHVAGAITFSMLLLVTSMRWKFARLKNVNSSIAYVNRDGVQLLLQIAWVTVGLSLIGVIIDIGVSPYSPSTAASLLRFYWFRWFDIVLPLTWVIVLWVLVLDFSPMIAGQVHQTSWSWTQAGVPALLVLTLAIGARFYVDRISDGTPPADRRLFLPQPNLDAEQKQRLRYEWLTACKWISENTPKDSLWFTPRHQQTFKWYAARAEVFSWKDVPQDNPSVLEWFDRSRVCAQPRSPDGQLRDWTTEELTQLSQKYGFEWILIDRRFQRVPPRFPLVYPVNQNFSELMVLQQTYVVFRISGITN